MVRILFGDFLENKEQYEACEVYWIQLIEEIAQSLGQAGEWQQWMSRTYGDGITPLERDGNPIADARSQKLDRALRIIQDRVTDDEFEIGGWVTTEKEFLDVLPKDEMVIWLTLSEESAEAAKQLLEKWMTPETTPAEMKTFMDTMFDELGIEYDS